MSISLNPAILGVPLYRELYAEHLKSAVDSNEESAFPILEKKHVMRGFPANFMTADLRNAIELDEIEYTMTSGSSGEKMQILRRRGWWLKEYERTYRHHEALGGFRVGVDRKAILTTAVCSSAVCYLENLGFDQRILSNTLYINTDPDPTRWTPADIQRMAEEIDTWQPKYLDADPIYLALFLSKANQFSIALPKHMPEVITLSYELCTGSALRIIKKYMTALIYQLFGSTEAGYLYIEDKRGIRRCPELSSICYVPFDESRQLYSLFLTSYKNEFMPLVNYRTGDILRLATSPDVEVAESTPVMQFCGREKDVIFTARGRGITAGEVDNVVDEHCEDLLTYQVVADKANNILFRYATENGAKAKSIRHVATAMEALFDVDAVSVRQERAILPEATGKFCTLKTLRSCR